MWGREMKNWFRYYSNQIKIINIFNISKSHANTYTYGRGLNEIIGNIHNLFFTRSKELVSIFYGNGLLTQLDFENEGEALKFMRLFQCYLRNNESILDLDISKYLLR
jgi:hypothetical protein